MSVTHTTSAAPTDLTSTPAAATTTTPPYRREGLLLAGGAATWALGTIAFGVDPGHSPVPALLFGITSGAFQVGLLALLRVFRATDALGAGRIARTALTVESVFVGLAICSTIVDAIGVSDLSQAGWMALDAFWPLSMLGMLLIGIRVAIAGRWRGRDRFWPLVAESWAPVVIPAVAVLGPGPGRWFSAAHLLVGYTALGLLVARKQA